MSKRSKRRSRGSAPQPDEAKKAVPQTAKTVSLSSQVLPAKMASLFSVTVKCYETKQWKKGIKHADMILKKFPNHGETMAMKGLIMNCLDKREDGMDLVKSGLRNNIKSHVCWHVYGLIYRADRNYAEAIKCYLNALRIDKDNVQILRDLSLLQIQMRDLSGFQETRRKILVLQSGNRLHWLAYAVGSHLNGKLTQSIDVLNSYEHTIEKMASRRDYELSEMLLYKNEILEELGDLDRTLEHMNEIEPYVLDSLSLRERRGFLLVRQQDLKGAKEVFAQLLDQNPDNADYHRGLRMALGFADKLSDISDADVEPLSSLYAKLELIYPRSTLCQTLPLEFCSGELFRSRVDAFMQRRLQKAMVSMPQALGSVLLEPSKLSVVEELLAGYIVQLRQEQRFHEHQLKDSAAAESLFWTLFCASYIRDKFGHHSEALTLVEAARQLEPGNLDAQMLEARIYKHMGSFVRAHKIIDAARCSDLKDRYLNTKCVRMALRAGLIDEAERVVSLFLRDGDTLASLFEMQCMWFELNAGEAFLEGGEFGRALKKFAAVEKHFEDIHEDQFDFHTYCLRKMTLRSYVRTLRFEDTLRVSKFFVRAAKNAVKTYFALSDHRSELARENDRVNGDHEEKEKQKRASAKARREAKRSALQKKNESGDKGKTDPDPHGEKLAATATPLEDATKYVKALQAHAPNDVETHLLALELYERKDRPLLALRALRRVWEMAPGNVDVQASVASFFVRIESRGRGGDNGRMEELVERVVELQREALLGGVGARPFAEQLLGAMRTPTLAAAKLLLALDDDNEEQVLQMLTESLKADHCTLKSCLRARAFVQRFLSADALLSFDSAASECFPLADKFQRD